MTSRPHDSTTLPPQPAARSALAWLSDADLYRLLERLLLESGTAEDICQRIVDLAEQDTRVATCSIFLVDAAGEFLCLAATNNPSLERYLNEPTYRVGEGITGWVFRYREPALLRDPKDPEECARLADPARGLPAPTPGGVPFSEGAHDGWLAASISSVDGKECVGVIRIQPRVSWLELTRVDLNRLQVIARLAYLVIRNARLHEQEVEEAEAEALETITAKVAHRIGNKLYALANQVEAMQLAISRGNPETEILCGMRETLESTRALVRALVKQASLPPLNPRPVPVGELLRSTAGACVPCQFLPEVGVGPGAETLVCDPDQLRTALDEIVQNCVEHAGADVHLRLEAAANRGRTTITISDNGPGITAEMKGQIFEPMFTTREGGTGWGLVIAREIVEKHGGAISEEGTPGQGARFVIRLPTGRTSRRPAPGR